MESNLAHQALLKISKKNDFDFLKDEFDFLSDIRATSEHTFGLIISLLRNYKNAISTTNANAANESSDGCTKNSNGNFNISWL